jgi:hypothetical protein
MSPREEMGQDARARLTRRQVLRLFGGTAAGAALGASFPSFIDVVGPNPAGVAHAQTADAPIDNPIVIENRQPGSAGWQLGAISGRAGYAIANDTQGQIKGYASSTRRQQGRADQVPHQREPGTILHHRGLQDGLVQRPGRPPPQERRAAGGLHPARPPSRRNHRSRRVQVVSDLHAERAEYLDQRDLPRPPDQQQQIPDLHHLRRARRRARGGPSLPAARHDLPGLQQLPERQRDRQEPLQLQ